MTAFNDPYMDDPYFRDASIVNRYGRCTDRPTLDRPGQAKTWKWLVLTVGAILVIIGVVYSPYGGKFGTIGPIANSTMSTVGQGR